MTFDHGHVLGRLARERASFAGMIGLLRFNQVGYPQDAARQAPGIQDQTQSD